MRFNCQFAVNNMLPVYRSIIAKQLYTKHGLNQEQIANKLGLTQPAVCNYVTSKRATKDGTTLGIDFIVINSLACETADKLANGKINSDEMKNDFCDLCMKLKEEDVGEYNI